VFSTTPVVSLITKKMIISDLSYFEEIADSMPPMSIQGGSNIYQANLVNINQMSIAVSYGGPAIATTFASVSQSNSVLPVISISSESWAISYQ